MKRVLTVIIVAALFALAGCQDAQLAQCQDQNAELQAQVKAANAAIQSKDTKIATLEAKNLEAQNTAIQSITAMMTKQAEKDKELKDKLAEAQKQCKDLKAQNRIQQTRIADLEKQITEQ